MMRRPAPPQKSGPIGTYITTDVLVKYNQIPGYINQTLVGSEIK
jgi:hypothetical protein